MREPWRLHIDRADALSIVAAAAAAGQLCVLLTDLQQQQQRQQQQLLLGNAITTRAIRSKVMQLSVALIV